MANEITWRLEHERIGRLLLHYAMPAVIGTMVNALYNIVDRIFIGQGVGPLAMAVLTLTFPILLFLQAFGMLIGAGAATRVSIYLGRRENEMAEKVLGNAFTLTFIITLATVVPCMIWMKDLILAFGGSEQILPYAKAYLHYLDERKKTNKQKKQTKQPKNTKQTEYRGSGDAPDLPQFWLQRCHACFRLSEESNVYHADRGDNQCDTRSYFHFLAGYGD